MLESFGGKYSITELDKATQYYTNDRNAKYSDLTGEANRALRDKVRANLKYHKGVFVIPGTEFLVQEKTKKLNEFLKGKKTIKQTELIKKLEELGYKTPKLYVNTLKKQKGLHIIRDAEKVPHPRRESKLYSKTELNKAAKDMFEGKKYDSLNPTERKVIQGKLFHAEDRKYSKFRKINNPLSTQEIKDIKTKYGNVIKKWDFNNNRFGIGYKGNEKIYDKIRNFVAEPKPYELTTDLTSADGWMGAQMNRAYKLEDTRYKPIRVIRNGKEKIAGFIDNTEFGGGKKYMFADQFIKGSNADGVLMSTHPDYLETKKFRDIAQKGKVPVQGALKNILRNKGVDTTRISLSDLYKYMMGEVGIEGTKNAIEQHHIKGVDVRATGNYQLLNRDLNALAREVSKEIKANNLQRVKELEKLGVRVDVGSEAYGTGPGKASSDFLKIKDKVTSFYKTPKGEKILGSLQQFLKQDVIGLSQTNAGGVCNIPSIVGKKAGGGRIGFAAGSNCARQMEISISQNPLKVTQEISELPGNKTINTFKTAAKGFLGALGRFGPAVGKYGAIAAAGVLAKPAYDMVRQFVNDDPSTYLTNPEQMEKMLLSTIEDQARKKPRSEILDWTHTGATVGATASAVPGTGALYKYRRGLLDKTTPIGKFLGKEREMIMGPRGKGYGKLRAGAGAGMKLLSGMFTPAGLLATEPLRIAQMRREGESWGEVAKSPTLWMGPAFAPSMTRIATAGMKKSSRLAKALRLGMNPAALRLLGKAGGYGLAASIGLTGYDKYQDWKNKRGWFAEN
tara:strand:+ start:613 stop:2982 length:2370 start_codon:yes stop_codon:yes gene_type:complete